MRMTMRAVMMSAALMVASAARAQILDGPTGQIVNAASDPVDFSLVASGQPGNIGSEIAANQFAAFQAQVAATNQATVDANNAAFNNNNTDGNATDAPVVPSTPKPMIGPKGATFHGAGQVTIAEMDPAAKVFYTTNGKRPTQSSAIYSGPITVSAKTKVRAMAWDVNFQRSGVVSKTFKVKN